MDGPPSTSIDSRRSWRGDELVYLVRLLATVVAAAPVAVVLVVLELHFPRVHRWLAGGGERAGASRYLCRGADPSVGLRSSRRGIDPITVLVLLLLPGGLFIAVVALYFLLGGTIPSLPSFP